MFGKNRRKFPRLPVHHLIKYKTGDQKEVVSFARNVSASGILFYADDKLDANATLELMINFPDAEKPVPVTVRIVRVKPLKIGGFEIGAEFKNIDENIVKLLQGKIQNTFRIAKEKA